MDTQRARSSCFYNWTYDVFLNFRGEDTRSGFTGFLYNALRQKGIHTFFDDVAIQRGKEITPSLLKAIEESRMAITVFSPNYASSAYCLDELVHILEHIKLQGRLVWPVFYDVEPSQVRCQKGSYAEALTRHVERYGRKRVQKWSLALSEAANLAGLEIKKGNGYEYDHIQRIIEDISTKINRTPLHVTDYPVGLKSRVLEVNSLLDVGSNEGVNMVGIHGIGGAGKTTIARAVYNLIGDKFEGLCFLSSVREISNKHGLSHLQETLLAKLVGEKDIKLGNVSEGVSIIKHRLNRKKVLLVLDDVDEQQQLKALAGRCDWFGCGSTIIITTRDKHLLVGHGVDRIYAVKELNDEEALQLFSWNAFRQDEVNPNYLEISKHVVHYSSGLPLALEIIGSNFHGRGIDEWISALDGYSKTPDTKIFEVLKLSYDTLGSIEKEVFLDVACFFKGYILGYIKDMLLSFRGIKSEYVIGVLIDKSLIKVSDYSVVTMHDLIQDMGKEIIRQESPIEPGGRSRLWFYKDILHVLKENTGTDKIEVLILDLPKGKEVVQWSGKAFKNMKNLKMLIIRNAYFTGVLTHLPNSLRVLDWSHYPGNALPSDFHPTNLFSLKLANSSCVSLEPLITKNMENLKRMNFGGCEFLRQLTDLSGVPNLEELKLDFCPSLIEIHDSVGFLSKLRVLDARYCVKLTTLPREIKLTSLESLTFRGCSRLQTFPEVFGKMEKTRAIYLQGTAIEELPYSIQNITGLQELRLSECQCLKQLPATLLKLPKLSDVRIKDCERFRHFSKWEGEERKGMGSIESSSSEVFLDFKKCNLTYESLSLCLSLLPNVVSLDLSSSTITILPICMKECHRLRELYISNCEQLQEIEGMPPNLEILEAQNCLSLPFHSSSMLMHQAFREPGGRQFILPGQEVPKWFHHCRDGYSTEFWVRKEIPDLAVCVVIHALNSPEDFDGIFLSVNGRIPWSTDEEEIILIPQKGNHIFLCHLQGDILEDILEDFLDDDLGPFLPDQWNHVEVYGKDDGTIKSIGVLVYEQENVLFSRPTPLKTTWNHVYNSNSTTLDSTSNTISEQGGMPMQTSSEKQPHKTEMEIKSSTAPPQKSTMVPVLEKDHEEVGSSKNQETFNPPDFRRNEISVSRFMDLEAFKMMTEKDFTSAIEGLLTGEISISSKMHQSATQSIEPVVQISSFEALQKELKCLLVKYDFCSLLSDDMHRSNISSYIEDLGKKFESLLPAHQSFIMNFRNFFVNAASNHDKLNEVSKKEFQLKEEKEGVEKKLQEARAKDEKMTALVSLASLRVKEIVSSIEKEAFEFAINEYGKQKEILRTECISWFNQSKDLVVELTKIEEIAQFLEVQVKADETNFQQLVASIPF